MQINDRISDASSDGVVVPEASSKFLGIVIVGIVEVPDPG